ncbi:MAG: preprotein translocase subunit SecY [Planctomycetaceae bacterium]|jgi:preprotein translocase subunit SecY|nr:preprotein translocase subunit SecY [Planctomycetaceae bacterium]
MFQKIRVIFSIKELRQKIILTLLLLAVYRVGSWIPLPIVDVRKMSMMWERNDSVAEVMSQVAVFTGTQFETLTIFGLGIMPYISASIIFQLLATVFDKLKALQKEGESGRKKINEWTRYATILICIFQSFFYVMALGSQSVTGLAGGVYNDALLTSANTLPIGWILTAVLIMTTGTAFLMWLGEQIDEYGIGNGISLLIMAGIISSLPGALTKLSERAVLGFSGGFQQLGVDKLLLLAVLFVAVIVGVIYITKGQRRIPTQSQKHVRGRQTFGGGRQYLPLKVNQAGVMPIIFASSLLLFPLVLFSYLKTMISNAGTAAASSGWINAFVTFCNDIFQRQTFTYILMFIALIYFFCYFWTAVTFNPKDIAENLKNHGSFIQGRRPGNATAAYLEKVMKYITYVGASFIAVIAVLPNIISTMLIPDNFMLANFFGGTSLLIVVSVIIDLVDKIDSHLVMRNYKGLLERSK